MPRRVLLAWEAGGGLGHVTGLLRIGARLAGTGFTVFAAVKNVAAAEPLAQAGIAVFQAPIWPATLAAHVETGRAASTATMGDILAWLGLADPMVLASVLAAWRRTFSLLRPDLVLCDYAPGATLAARGRLPVALAGNGFATPPAELTAFPVLHEAMPPAWHEEEVVEAVCRALRALDAPPIERLPQVFAAEATLVTTLPALDPYRRLRHPPARGPLLDAVPDLRADDASDVFAYLGRVRQAVPDDVVAALARLGGRLRVFGPGLGQDQAARLRWAGCILLSAPLRLATELARYRLVVHNGNAGLCNEALLAGIPQLALGTDIEKDLNGQALEELGVGRLVRIYEPGAALAPGAIDALMADEGLAGRAMEVARANRARLSADPAASFIDACLTLAA